jgi:hypothetical protein
MFEKKSFIQFNDIVCLELSSSTSYKTKKALIDLLTANGFRVSFVMNKSVKLLFKEDPDDVNTYKCRQAFKLNIPVINVKLILDYVSGNLVSSIWTNGDINVTTLKKYVIVNKESESNFKNGLIAFNKNGNF